MKSDERGGTGVGSSIGFWSGRCLVYSGEKALKSYGKHGYVNANCQMVHVTFVKKLRQDQQAVQAGLVLKWNNGMVEGHINRLKFLKRSMYGRANFDLLRLRVLHH